jgi:hypothetical protein
MHATQRQTQTAGLITWHMIEFWMENNYKDVWDALKDRKGESLCSNVNSFFSAIFIYGSENMIKQISVKW